MGMKKRYHSNGKLLLTGEYVVLDGASALAIPTIHGQSLEVLPLENNGIHWESLDENGSIWFQEKFQLKDYHKDSKNPSALILKRLLKILQEAKKLNPAFLENSNGYAVKTKLDFPRNWGLGTSSTLINNIAQWAEVDGFALLARSFGGSGYDIAAANSNTPLIFTLKHRSASIKKINLPWKFTDKLFFIHLNQKQDSKEGIAIYRNKTVDGRSISRISEISNILLTCQSLAEFENLMNEHEEIISEIINLPTIKSRLFSDYPHSIKSLGAWGGDFVLATGEAKEMLYFREKGYGTIVPFKEMIK